MTRRRFYAPPVAFALDEQTVSLSADEARHARGVLRLQPGDEVYVFDGAGKEFRCAVRELDRDGAALDVLEEVETARPESPLNLTLGIALLKGEKFDLVVQKAVELGVSRIIPLDTDRTDVRLRDNQDAHNRMTRWRRIALEAAKQSGRASVPEIIAPLTFEFLCAMSATEEEKSPQPVRLMFSERGGKSLSETANSFVEQPKRIVALVGPEGGWADEEIELAREGLWKIVTLGGRTLRAETAAIVITALLQHRLGDLV
ncbi:MAG TPA: 16S rRNA (uracil(1498)-N(3))-methyltransferase [Pyrinomonadaceae bacterium]|nr:16S rRNA (uracil(1498)-N(3))-methyltransferase [Pyrinomonadaceae bacterium]